MGVLTTRLHGSITAIAGIASASASAELPDKACLKGFFNATGQTLLLSSLYAPSYSDFDFPLSPSSNPAVSSAICLANFPSRLHPPPASVGPPALASQSASIQFHRASSVPSGGINSNLCPSRPGISHLNLSDQLSLSFLPRYSHSLSECQYPSPLHQLSFYWRSQRLSEFLSDKRPECRRCYSLWRCPSNTAPHCRLPVSSLNSLKPILSCRASPSFPRFSQASQFERLISSLYSSCTCPPSSVSAKLLHTWHAPISGSDKSQQDNEEKIFGKQKPTVAVVLLGWLGAQQRHLRRYAEWYTSRGIHAVTFVVPMKDLLSIKAGDKAEKHVDILTQHLAQWLKEDNKGGEEKYVIFHTFSNTGWLTYGAVLERLIHQGDHLLDKIKGCVVDSAPSAKPDPQVWASGFTAALLKKGSIATQKVAKLDFGTARSEGSDNKAITQPQPDLKETALLAMLEKFFSVFLRLPYVNRRLNDVISVLSNRQPSCPQLYIYSTADTVIPAKSVESFIEEQRKAGRKVSACNFQWSPHVDHFRTFPDLYSDQLTSFLKLCVPQRPSQ